MNDVDPSAQARRLASEAASGGKGLFRDIVGTGAAAQAPSGTPDGNETLAWLAGNRMPDRRKGLQPPTGTLEPRADEALNAPRPSDPIQAAQKRASVLADLNSNAPRDPRVLSVFEADPIVAEDPANGNLVTQSMLRARGDVFDAVLIMLGRPTLSRTARSRLALTLKNAYPMLSDDAQVEWALSEVRLEETKSFFDTRPAADHNAVGRQVQATIERHDLWAAARAFSMAAHLMVGASSGSAALADLLELREAG